MADAKLLVDRVKTPVGTLRLVVTEAGALVRLGWFDEDERKEPGEYVRQKDPLGVTSVLLEYFAGHVESIDALATQAPGTDFQQRVWRELRAVPAGTTASYAEIARRIRSPEACRAVGAANHVNPIGIVVPCHRVIGKNGALTGYAGGIERKRWLLEHEAKHARAAAGRQIAFGT